LVRVNPAFGFGEGLAVELIQDGRSLPTPFPAVDQFSGETAYFSDCILHGIDPEPDGEEGRLDVRVIAAVERALTTGRPVSLDPVQRHRRPAAEQVRKLSVPHQPGLVRAAEPGEG
ncbi:MAG: gfo/Idh/MocA family oxidoreductase, partial [Chloroflexi bacterium]|nr:gfo/Idh/MocA family oxidoreductase [Chloroflexota bacterium]